MQLNQVVFRMSHRSMVMWFLKSTNNFRRYGSRPNGLRPTRFDDDAWLERVTQQVLQRSATEAEHQAMLQSSSQRRRIDRLNALLNSEEFNQVWSVRLLIFMPLQSRGK